MEAVHRLIGMHDQRDGPFPCQVAPTRARQHPIEREPMSDQIPSGQIPSGWYPDPNPGADAPGGQMRYWNGSAWTEHTTAPTTAPTVAEPARKPGTFIRWGIPALVGVLALLFGIGIGAAGGGSAEDLEAGSTVESTPAPTVTVDPSAARAAELDQLAADLDEIAAEQARLNEELAAKEAELEAREQAVAAAEQEQAFVSEPPASEPEPVPEPGTGAEVWNLPGPDLDCSDIGHPVTITGPDYHGLDADGDGIGCEG